MSNTSTAPTVQTSTEPTEAPVAHANIRVAVTFGLSHITLNPDAGKFDATHESVRLLRELAQRIEDRALTEPLSVGDILIARDINGNRVGVLDVFKSY